MAEFDDITYDDDDPYGLRAVAKEKAEMEAAKVSAQAQASLAAESSRVVAVHEEEWLIRARIPSTDEMLPTAIMRPSETILDLRRKLAQGRNAESGQGAIGLFNGQHRLRDNQTLLVAGLSHGIMLTAVPMPDRLLATASVDGTVRLWNVATKELSLSLNGHEGPITCVAFNPSGDTVVTASADALVKMWKVETGECLRTFTGHTQQVTSAEFCIAGDGERIATASDDDTAKVFDAFNAECLLTMGGHSHFVRIATWSPDSHYVLTASFDGTAKLWHPDTKECLQTFTGHKQMIRSASFAPGHGEFAVTASSDKTARIWDMFGKFDGGCLQVLEGHTGTIFCARFTPDAEKVLTASHDQTAKLFRVATGECLLTLTGHDSMVLHLSIDPSGLVAATASSDRSARLWSLETGQCLQKLGGWGDDTYGHIGGLITAEFSVDGESLATTSDDCTAKVWGVRSGKLMTTLAGHKKQVCRGAFSPW